MSNPIKDALSKLAILQTRVSDSVEWADENLMGSEHSAEICNIYADAGIDVEEIVDDLEKVVLRTVAQGEVIDRIIDICSEEDQEFLYESTGELFDELKKLVD